MEHLTRLAADAGLSLKVARGKRRSVINGAVIPVKSIEPIVIKLPHFVSSKSAVVDAHLVNLAVKRKLKVVPNSY